ncbi:Rieske (2Fe-2S) protein [Sphingomonas naphthae]|uniref:Rieske (2Fe-2S) protein n=1 Tax=Sphingomonas naphthae TaxID=1813468 RepID=A0ABY7TQ34_9SPHN|nr:Rieske (2Fe-2S) protein [Sphingomonas naphthae]WCT74801.1 Rieske (2Fe-2S) protein [Sphingomonas naphthae]
MNKPPTRVYATPPGLPLGPVDQIADGAARSFAVPVGDGRFHGFIVRMGEAIHAYVDRCPHVGMPLAMEPDDYLTPSGRLIGCSWHGAVFAIDTGRCLDGPCAGLYLTPWPVSIVDGDMVTAGPET